MRKDQPELKKEFKELKDAIKLLKRTVEHRESVIEYLNVQRHDLTEDVLIDRIEYQRLLDNKPALTKRYYITRLLDSGIKELDNHLDSLIA